jgi:hypothetical protein
MMKKLKQEENKDKTNPGRNGYRDEVISSKSYYASVVLVPSAQLKHISVHQSVIPDLRPVSFFHPPGA